MSVGHDEYWSGAQRANVEAARDAGVNLAFFSGNEVFWKTRWENSIDGSGTALPDAGVLQGDARQRQDRSDPPTWTGTWRDPRFSPPADGGRPENALTGTIFMVNDAGHDTPSSVPEADGKMRFWRNTSIATLGAGHDRDAARRHAGLRVGRDLDNGFRPPGLIRLSTTTVDRAPVLQDYGSTYGAGHCAPMR